MMLPGDFLAKCGLSACEDLLLPNFRTSYSSHFSVVTCWRPYLSFLCSFYRALDTVQFSAWKTDWFSVRKLAWNQHICVHDSPWNLSVINYLCTEEKLTISCDQPLCFPSFLIFKGNVCIEYMSMLLVNVKQRTHTCTHSDSEKLCGFEEKWKRS